MGSRGKSSLKSVVRAPIGEFRFAWARNALFAKHSLQAVVVAALFLSDSAASAATDFCRDIRTLPLTRMDRIEGMLHKIQTARTSEGSQGNGRSIEDIERHVRPYTLSDELKQLFVDEKADDLGDYDVYRSPDDMLFQFTQTEGSGRYPEDIWAIRDGDQLKPLGDGPDLGEDGDVIRIYGVYRGDPVLLQYAFFPGPGPAGSGPLKIAEIRAVKLRPDTLETVCVIHPRSPR